MADNNGEKGLVPVGSIEQWLSSEVFGRPLVWKLIETLRLFM